MEQMNCERVSSNFDRENASKKLGKNVMNCHHIIWTKADHHDFVRADVIFQPEMYIPAHNALHKACPSVPRFNDSLLGVIREEFHATTNTLDSIDRLLMVINGADKKTIDSVMKEFCIHAIESQIPFLRGNIKTHEGKSRK